MNPIWTAARTRDDSSSLEAALGLVAEVAAAHADEADAEARFPVEALAVLRETGLLGLLVPREYGGMGGSASEVIEAGIRLSRCDMSVGLVFVMHCQQVATLVAHADEKLRGELLPEIAEGKYYLASVTTEAGKGGHLLTADTPLAESGGELTIDRFAPIVTGGAHADGFLLTMRSPHAVSPHQVSLVYAGREHVAAEISGSWQPLGMRASQSIAMRLVGQVPAHHVLGEDGDFSTIVTATFGPLAHLGWAACWLGTAAGALSRTVRLLRSAEGRKQFDVSSELLLVRLAGARQRLVAVHALLTHACDVVERAGDLSTPRIQLLLNTLKVTASEECYRAVDELVEALGVRHGYLRGSPTGLERALRDLRSASLNYHNDRLRLADGRLTLLDADVSFA